MKTDSWWINAGDYDGIECEGDTQQTVPDKELLDVALIPLKIAKQRADEVKNDLAAAMNFDEYDGVASQTLGKGEYKWLKPSSSDTCGDLEGSLLHNYEYMQRISVGIQKALENSTDNEKLVEVLTAIKHDLRAILTEIQRALFEKCLTTEGRNVSKGIIPQNVVGGDESSRYIFNLKVFKHYLEALEQVIQELEGHRSRIS